MIKNTKNIISGLLVIFVALLTILIFARKTGLLSSNAIEVTAETAKRRTIIETITASGKIQPETEIKISADVSGEIIELNVKEGDYVKKRQILLKIKPDIYESFLKRMEATLESAKANLENAKSRLKQTEAQFYQAEQNYLRYKQLYEKGAISKSEYDSYFTTYNISKAEIEAAKQNVLMAEYNVKSNEASLIEAKANLTKTVIYSPIDGTVSKLNVKIGERVVGTMQMAGTEILRIADFSFMEIIVDVNESDIIRIHQNDSAHVEIEAYPHQIFKGIVTAIANSPITQSSSLSNLSDQLSTYQVHIRILNPNNKFKILPGMSANVDIYTNKKENVISIPIQAVITRPDIIFDNLKLFSKNKQIECVIKVINNKTKLVPVKTGIQDDKYIEILCGLKENDTIVTGPFNVLLKKLKNNDRVKISTLDNLNNNG